MSAFDTDTARAQMERVDAIFSRFNDIPVDKHPEGFFQEAVTLQAIVGQVIHANLPEDHPGFKIAFTSLNEFIQKYERKQ